MKFEDKLIKLRKEKGLSQEELGNGINVSRQAVSKWESGQVKPEIEKIKELSNFFNVSTDYLIKDEIEENEPKTKKTNNKKKIFKIIKIALLVIVALYLITVIYKYTILAICVRKINQIEDYNEYKIWQMSVTKDDMVSNELMKISDYIIYKNGVCYKEAYTNSKIEKNGDSIYYEYSSHLSSIPEYIGYENLSKNIYYNLTYDYELGKYIYADSEEINTEGYWNAEAIRIMAEEVVGNCIGIIGVAVDPRDKVFVSEGYIDIQDNGSAGYLNVSIDRNTGFLRETKTVINDSVMSMQYDYEIENVEDSEIQEPSVEYIVLDEMCEE